MDDSRKKTLLMNVESKTKKPNKCSRSQGVKFGDLAWLWYTKDCFGMLDFTRTVTLHTPICGWHLQVGGVGL
jgi:hypothetical protein